MSSTALLIPLLRSIGFIPAATALHPSLNIALVKTVAVVVPSPACWLVFSATCFINEAPRFSNLSLNSMAQATVTPSLVIFGAPNDCSMTTFHPFGPRVTSTASASFSHPFSISALASRPKRISFAPKCFCACFKSCL